MSPVVRSIRRVLSQPAFLVAVAVLAVSALSLNAAVGFLRLHFKKLPCDLRVASLKEGLPSHLGSWVQVSRDQPIDPELQQQLATSQYVFRDYVDTNIISLDEVNLLKNADRKEYASLLLRIQERAPQAVISAAVTYYTGLVDTVAHVPERCYIADGYDVTHSDKKTADLQGANGWRRRVSYQFLNFQDSTGARQVTRNVGYLFHVNGAYESSSWGVRARLQDLRERYGYYAKVELMTQAPVSLQSQAVSDASAKAMENFLAAALPDVEKCLPDWQQLHAARGPAAATK